ncbi:50S ribosomal protein L3 N(5)-glutamine methyltransferase [Gynuella sunshinyii]|uniref:50S ribosomal protein L3 N(5)-glutamine methyltransferase n=1 Tax=Gynuella sunshinyii TaxID=1445505 RepID=UPI000A679116|nr:50S ribosomal protein L3 N(5)-glutamine methyltransferase [Gynuella sunshinyii]
MHNLLTIRDYVRWATSEFDRRQLFLGHGSDSYWDEATFLVLGAIHLPWDCSANILDARLTEEEKQHVQTLLRRRIEDHVPVPYLLGEAWFCDLRFKINEHTLIPRSPIAELIQHRFAPWLSQEPDSILDLCTGSGCIGIACAHEFDQTRVLLTDISAEALVVAQQNITDYRLEDRVSVLHSDLFSALTEAHQFDLIVTNPPYVDAEDFADMPEEYRNEPSLALVSGHDGLDACKEILRRSADHLTEHGVLICEVGNSAGALQEQYPDIPFTWIEFQNGGFGVFLLTKAELLEHRHWFEN